MNLLLMALLGAGVLGLVVFSLFVAIVFRRVVPTNEVHIVQRGAQKVSYGAGKPGGSVYYEWPSSFPKIGVRVTKFPISNFDSHLKDHDAFDRGRLPFKVDVQAFMRIEDSDVAAERVGNFEELLHQLQGILQGAVRSVLAQHPLEEILGARSELSASFTSAVEPALKEWGVVTAKNIEFMDLRDTGDNRVIRNIMAKEQSRIDMESRTAVAENSRAAQEREIEAQRQVDLSKQDAVQQVGQRTADQERAVGIAKEKSRQEVLAEQKMTTERQMEVQKVTDVKSAEIAKSVAIVRAEQDQQVQIVAAEAAQKSAIVQAEGQRQTTELVAKGQLEAAKNEAEGIKARGEANAKAEELILMAPVTAQITLAKEIGENAPYQKYLVTLEEIKANQAVGVEMAGAMRSAEMKIIANSGDIPSGITKVGDLLTSKGGQGLAAMIAGLSQTDEGRALVARVTGEEPVKAPTPPRRPRDPSTVSA